MTLSRYFDPYLDFSFKKLFGEESSKDLLIDFLNTVLPPQYRVADLTFVNTEQLPAHMKARKAVFDVMCTGKNGETFIVEMQKAKQEFFKDRALFDLTFPIQAQAKKGDWDYQLQPVILVAVLNFLCDKERERQKLRQHVTLQDQDGDRFFDKLHMVFLQMPTFNKTESELKTHEDKWYYLLKNMQSLDGVPAALDEPVFAKAFQIAEMANYSQELQEAYRKELMDLWDGKNVVDTARKEGRSERSVEIARNLKAKGLPTALIAETTGLSPEEIERL